MGLNKLIEEQIKTVYASLEDDMMKCLTDLPIEMRPLTFKVSRVGLRLCKEQFDRFKRGHDGVGCTRQTSEGMGVPCSHQIKVLLAQRGNLVPEDFHFHWQLGYAPNNTVCVIMLIILMR